MNGFLVRRSPNKVVQCLDLDPLKCLDEKPEVTYRIIFATENILGHFFMK